MTKNYKYLSRYRFSKPLRKVINRINHKFASKNIKRGNPRIAIFAFDHIGLEINNFGIYEEDLLNAIISFLKDKVNIEKFDLIIDVGANIGNHSLYFSKISKKVFSYEPNPNTYQLLKYNTSNISNIDIYNIGISNNTEKKFLNESNFNIGNSAVVSGIKKQNIKKDDLILHEINAFKLDDLENLFNEEISMIKIDVEGHELEVMDGAKNLIEKNKPMLIFEHNKEINKEKALKINEFLQQQDYVIYTIQPNFNFFSNLLLRVIAGFVRVILGEKLIFKETNNLPHKNFSGFQLILAIPKNKL
jgi:FkbM family methyltransferase